ncbi:hypothetical protein ATO13_22551 [Stappia sp. 22II-S9-Z10]|nr:hypothetical protein ATO13_22551 [Stappia sp. 22II-S9-Z10]
MVEMVSGEVASSGSRQAVDVNTLAQLIGVTPRQIQIVAKEGYYAAERRGQWPLVASVRGYVRYLHDQIAGAQKSTHENRLRDAKAKEIEVRTARVDRTVIDLAEAQEIFDEITGAYLASLEGLPARLTRNVRERTRIQQIFDTERQRLADNFGEARGLLASGLPDDEAEAEDDTG